MTAPSWRVLPGETVARLLRSWQQVTWSWEAADVDGVLRALGWREVRRTGRMLQVDTGLGIGGGYGCFLFHGGRVARLTVRVSDVVPAEQDRGARAFLLDAFSATVDAAGTVLGTPSVRVPGDMPEVRWQLVPITVRVESIRVAVDLVLADSAYVAWEDESDRVLAHLTSPEAAARAPAPPEPARERSAGPPPGPPGAPVAAAPPQPAAAPPPPPSPPSPPFGVPPAPPADRPSRRAGPPPAAPTLPPAPVVLSAPAARPAPSRGGPDIMQKVVPHGLVGYYLDQGYDRVAGYVYRWDDVRVLDTPAKLFDVLGLGYVGSPFARGDPAMHVIRWPGYARQLYRTALGGTDPRGMQSVPGGWVIERPPFAGNGYAPSRQYAIPQLKVDSIRLPHRAEMWRIDAGGAQEFVAAYDSDRWRWVRPPEEVR
jgi:hypothetical protein